jgi:aldehyde dehydrogenase (NAD+)
MSGVGRENGFDAMKEFTEIKTIVVELATGMPADPFAD